MEEGKVVGVCISEKRGTGLALLALEGCFCRVTHSGRVQIGDPVCKLERV